MPQENTFYGYVIDEEVELSLGELSRACAVRADWLLELVEEGIIEPRSGDDTPLRFSGASLRRVRIVRRLQADLGVNLAGAALAVELLEELEDLRRRVDTESR
jgi:chaperone modulatory protein CbpM